jgi:hypothetical protein
MWSCHRPGYIEFSAPLDVRVSIGAYAHAARNDVMEGTEVDHQHAVDEHKDLAPAGELQREGYRRCGRVFARTRSQKEEPNACAALSRVFTVGFTVPCSRRCQRL